MYACTCISIDFKLALIGIAIDISTLFLKVFLVHLNRNLHAVQIN